MITRLTCCMIFMILMACCYGLVPAQPDEMVKAGSVNMYVHKEGTGSPVVVIDVGLGDQCGNWAPIQTRLAREMTVITYDRAGYGRSGQGAFPRSSEQVARELKALLEAASAAGPYILVGHSIGGLNMQAFAGMFPDDVAGLVLLDPPPLSFICGEAYNGLQQMADSITGEWETAAEQLSRSENEQGRAQGSFLKTIASEHREMFSSSAKFVTAIESFGNIPVVVLASGRPNPMFGDIAEEYQQYWADQSRRLAGKSKQGRFIFLEECSHHIYTEEPEQIIDAIRSLALTCKKQ